MTGNDLNPLYPEIEPYATGRLALDLPHEMYWEQCGAPEGVPVLFLHGGPGAGATAANRRFFDPDHYRIVVYDQRGAGRSTPLGALDGNTTPKLVADIEALRRALDIAGWVVFGGSWGSTLALAYAEAHPERCLALVLRGVFLCREEEIDWFLNGMGRFFPEEWQAFAGHLPEAERADLLAGYHRRLIDPDPAVHMRAAHAWSRWEGACSTLVPSTETMAEFARDNMALGLARIEAHYFVNDIFLGHNQLLDRIDRMRAIPGYIVQGRYDMVCPIATADTLAQAWPEAEYTIVAAAGHSSMEPGIRSALIAVTDRLRDNGLGRAPAPGG
ncbi:MAG: prolyl aminopeptidase [Alphaproteobacteria bacterium]|jgi:proline iminopeptidase|nr:prolyl aminopeptidase [Alphaproteobacteria bacterium]MDP6515989.1 prolyl aminopeptidase [Alphaproteobacteria bacterium]